MEVDDAAAKEKPARGSEPRLSRDDAYDVLSSRRRRHVVRSLRTAGGATTLGALSRRLAAWENGHADERSVTPKERKRVYTALRQTHLPKLHEVGVVEYDPDRGTVSLAPRADDLRPYLRTEPRPPWATYYATVAAAGLALTAGLVLDVLPDAVGGPLVAGLLSLSIAALSGYHYWHDGSTRRDRRVALDDSSPGPGVDGGDGIGVGGAGRAADATAVEGDAGTAEGGRRAEDADAGGRSAEDDGT